MDFFMGYRQGGNDDARRRVIDRLEQELGRNSVVVAESIVVGSSLPQTISERIDRSIAFLAFVDEQWLSSVERIRETDDWVRAEIAHAARLHLPIIPLLVDRCRLPVRASIPADVLHLVDSKGHNIDLGDRFEDDMNNLVRDLSRIRKGHEWAARVQQKLARHFVTGNWNTARQVLRRALREANAPGNEWLKTNRIYPKLEDLNADLITLAEADEAFQHGLFEHVKFLLEPIRRTNQTAAIGYDIADVGVTAAIALTNREREKLQAQRHRFDSLRHRHADGCALLGANEIERFLTTAERTLRDLEALDRRILRLHAQATVRMDYARDPALYVSRSSGLLSSPFLTRAETKRIADKRFDHLPQDDLQYVHESDPVEPPPEPVIDLRAIAADETLFASPRGGREFTGPDGSDLEARLFALLVPGSTVMHEAMQRAILWGLESKFRLPSRSLAGLQFSITAPASIRPGATMPVTVWAHRAEDRDEVLRQAVREASTGAVDTSTDPPSLLGVRLLSRHLDVMRTEEPMLWRGRLIRSRFVVSCPPSTTEATLDATAEIHIDGLALARLRFPIVIANGDGPLRTIEPDETRHRRAFASFADGDRARIERRLRLVTDLVPDLQIEQRCYEFRKDEGWTRSMSRVIAGHDVFYLFWSDAARASADVEREWRCTLEAGAPFISGVALDGVSPPPELHDVPFFRWGEESVIRNGLLLAAE